MTECGCNFCRFGIRDGLGHDDGPDDPPPLPETDPRRIAWVARIRDWSMNDKGTPPVRDWQTERQAPDHDRPFVRRDR